MDKKGLSDVTSIRVLIGAIIAVTLLIIIIISVSYTNYKKLGEEPIAPTGGTGSEPPVTEPPVTMPPAGTGTAGTGGTGGATNATNASIAVILDSPGDEEVFGYNVSIPLKYAIKGFSASACWYNIDGGNLTGLSGCTNSTFNVSVGSHNMRFFANRSGASTLFDSSNFSIVIGAPSITLGVPVDGKYLNDNVVQFRYKPQSNSLGTCSLYGNFTGPFIANQTQTPTNNAVNTFSLSLSDGAYKWAVLCQTTSGAKAFSGNRTLHVDKIKPTASFVHPSGKYNSATIPLQLSIVDKSPVNCSYSVKTSGGANIIASANYNCQNINFNVPGEGVYNVSVVVNDAASNSMINSSLFSVSLGLPVQITTPLSLSNMRNNMTGNYILANDIDLTGFAWVPIGTLADTFKGSLNGNGRKIKGLKLSDGNANNVGFFGVLNGKVRNLKLEQISIVGNNNVGGIAGINYGEIKDSEVKGNLKGKGEGVGGVAGLTLGGEIISSSYNGEIDSFNPSAPSATSVGGVSGIVSNSSLIKNSWADGSVRGVSAVGGLVGKLVKSNVQDSYSKADVLSVGGINAVDAGGLVGRVQASTISSSQAFSGNVSGFYNVGGLVGKLDISSKLEQTHATMIVNGDSYVGGLVGRAVGGGSNTEVEDSYAFGLVNAQAYVGGLVGSNENGSVKNSFSRAKVTGTASATGGLIGFNTGGCSRVTSSYWDTQTSTQGQSSCGTGKTTGQMKQQSTYSGWDFNNVWNIINTQTYPFFRWQTVPNVQGIDNSLTGHFKFDEVNLNQGTTTDSSVYARHAQVVGTTLAQGAPGLNNALQFHGDSHVVASRDLHQTGELTFASWVRRTGDSTNSQTIISDMIAGSSWPSFQVFITTQNKVGVNVFYANAPESKYSLSSAGSLNLNTWYHVALSVNATSARLYVDGAQVSGVVPTGMPYNNLNDFWIGAKDGTAAAGGAREFFTGQIDEVRTYSRALSSEEIDDLYNLLLSPGERKLFSTPMLTLLILLILILIVLVVTLIVMLRRRREQSRRTGQPSPFGFPRGPPGAGMLPGPPRPPFNMVRRPVIPISQYGAGRRPA